MPTFEFHPSARQAIDQGGKDLLARVSDYIPKPGPAPSFPSQRPVAAHITDKDMLDEPMIFEHDMRGNYVARYFTHEGRAYGPDQDGYRDLRRLADQVVKAKWVNDAVGRAFVEDSIFLWCKDNFRITTHTSLSDYLLTRASDSIQPLTVWTPIAYLEVEREFTFGPAKLAPITASMLDAREQSFIEKSPENADQIRALFSRQRQEYQGLAAVVVELEAEKNHAMERGLELAEIIIGLLRLYTPAAYVPWLLCPCAVIGTEYVPHFTVFNYGTTGSFGMKQGALKPLPYPWRISSNYWEALSATDEFSRLANLIDDDSLTDFQTRLRTSILAYSKGLTLRDLNDRLVYTLSALEGLLLRDTSEPIQQNLGERLAFMLDTDPASRQRIVRTVRDVYDMRSHYIHHRISVTDEAVFEQFFPLARAAFDAALANIPQFVRARDFIDAIDRIKFGAEPSG